MAHVKFNEYLNKEITDINFLGLYNYFLDEIAYDATKMLHMVQITFFWLESINKLTPETASLLMFYTKVLQGLDEEKKYLNYNEVLYIIAKCDELVNKKCSTDRLNLYM